jgi:hypothetical protein
MQANQKERVDRVVRLYRRVGKFLLCVKILEYTLLFLTVFTSASLWGLLSEKLPRSTLWFGAIASTLTIGVTIYINSAGTSLARDKALSLRHDLGQFIARVRSTPDLSEIQYWEEYKEYQNKWDQLRFRRQA